MKIDLQDGNYSLQLEPMPLREHMQLLQESAEAAEKMGYHHTWRCFINYVFAHYQGNMVGETFIPYYPLEKYNEC